MTIRPPTSTAMPYDREAVHRIFDDLQFRVLREQLLETFARRRTRPAPRASRWPVPGWRRAPCGAWLTAHGDRPGRTGGARHLGT